MPSYSRIEYQILKNLNRTAGLLEKCVKAAGLQEKSLLEEDIDSFRARTETSRAAVEDAFVYLRTARSLERDLSASGRRFSPGFREEAGELGDRIETLSEKCGLLNLSLAETGEKLMQRYSARISGIESARKNNAAAKAALPFINSPEMIDISV